MSDLDLRPHYEAYRQTRGPSVAEEEAVWAAITERIQQGDAGPMLADEPTVHPGRRRLRWFVVGLGILATAAVLAMMFEPRIASVLDPARTPDAASFDAIDPPATDVARERARAPMRSRPRSSSGAPSTTARPEAEPEPEPEFEPPPLPEPAPPQEASVTPTPSSPPSIIRRQPVSQPEPEAAPASIEAEVELLQSAKRALASSRPDRALSLLRDHARRYPDGMMAPERDLLEVRALCAVGRPGPAERKASAALAANPRSPWASLLRRGCAAEDAP